MKKNITREQIVETALELMKNKSDLRGINMREIARTLGCAHTNIYNYFPSYNDLLWEAHAALQELFMSIFTQKLSTANSCEMQLTYFFEAFIDIYLSNKGWFWLAWHEHIDDERPKRDVETTKKANEELNRYISSIWKELSGSYPDADHVRIVLHNTHCYIVGEISNYLLGRGLIDDEAELKAYIAHEAALMFKLCLLGE
ncbi:MAG: TetR/AcrR family transcriptional regulator [Clostridiales bacterium]|nr:TetR/AcrR family transcriptional regulator [Clostridiales bacterium]